MVVILFLVLLLILVILLVFILLTFSRFVTAFFIDAPFIPTSDETIDNIINNLQLKKDSVFYDLGCGNASLIRRASELKLDMKIIGIEIDPIPYLLAKFFTRKNKNIYIRGENIFKANISDATHIYLYLYPKAVNDLIDNIKKQCVPGTLVASCDFEITSCTPTKVINLNNKHSKLCQKLFIYTL